MIDQVKMAVAFKNADNDVMGVRVKADGTRDGNGMRSVQTKLQKNLQNAGVSEDGARKRAVSWFHKNRA